MQCNSVKSRQKKINASLYRGRRHSWRTWRYYRWWGSIKLSDKAYKLTTYGCPPPPPRLQRMTVHPPSLTTYGCPPPLPPAYNEWLSTPPPRSQNVLKLTYDNVEFQNFRGEDPPWKNVYPPWTKFLDITLARSYPLIAAPFCSRPWVSASELHLKCMLVLMHSHSSVRCLCEYITFIFYLRSRARLDSTRPTRPTLQSLVTTRFVSTCARKPSDPIGRRTNDEWMVTSLATRACAVHGSETDDWAIGGDKHHLATSLQPEKFILEWNCDI